MYPPPTNGLQLHLKPWKGGSNFVVGWWIRSAEHPSMLAWHVVSSSWITILPGQFDILFFQRFYMSSILHRDRTNPISREGGKRRFDEWRKRNPGAAVFKTSVNMQLHQLVKEYRSVYSSRPPLVDRKRQEITFCLHKIHTSKHHLQ